MKRFFLIISIVFSTVPIAILIFIFNQTLELASAESLRREIQNEIDLTSHSIGEFIDERNANLSDWGQSPAVLVAFDFHRPEGLSSALANLSDRYGMYDWIAAVDTRGKTFAASKTEVNDLTEDDLSKLKDLKSGKGWNDGESLKFAMPLRNNLGQHMGFLIARCKVDVLNRFAEQIRSRLARRRLKSVAVGYDLVSSTDNATVDFRAKIQPAKTTFVSDLNLVATVQKNELGSLFQQFFIVVVLVAIATSALIFTAMSAIFSGVLRPIRELLRSLELVADGGMQPVRLKSRFKEIRSLETQANLLIETLDRHTRLLAEQAETKAFADLALQVSHDIRSPLSALNLALPSLSGISEERQEIIRTCVRRISSIAEDLNKKGRNASRGGRRESAFRLIRAVMDEKVVQFQARPQLELTMAGNEDAGLMDLHIQVEGDVFQRLLSNLINNAAESIEGEGRICVTLHQERSWVLIEIQDSGRGIPQDVLLKLGNRGATFGKSDGSGLGLAHAKENVTRWGGDLQIASVVNEGTKVVIRLPLVGND